MNPKKAVKELDKQLRKDPGNLILRIRLAGALYQVGRWPEAVEMYRSVAMAYQAQGRIDQAIAVCYSLLEIAPDHSETRRLLTELEARATARASEPPPIPDQPAQPQQVRQRPPPRPSGLDTDSLHPDSEPEMVPARIKRDSTPTDQRRQRLALPLPIHRSARGPGTPPARPRRRSSVPGGTAASAPTAPAPPIPRRPTDDEEAPTRIADKGVLPRGGLPIRSISFSSVGPSMSDVTAPEPTDAPISTATDAPPTNPTVNQTGSRRTPPRPTAPQRPRSRRPPVDAHDDAFTSPRARSVEETPPAATAVRQQSEDERTVFDDEREISMAFRSAFVEGHRDPGNVVVTDVDMTLLPGLPPLAAQAIAKGMNRMRVKSGEMILREGETGDSCFILATGEARVLKRDPTDRTGQVVEVSRLSAGELFGEMAMLSDSHRHASVQAVGACELLEIPRQHIDQVAVQFPEISAYLETFYRERLIATLVSTAPFFRPLEPDDRRSLVKNFRFSRVEEGARIVAEGQKAGGFYLVVLGTVEITKAFSEHRQVLLATLGEGAYFGEMSLLRGDTARATVTALGPTELAVLPAKNFYALVASHPILWDQVRQEAHRRELENAQIVTGVTGSV